MPATAKVPNIRAMRGAVINGAIIKLGLAGVAVLALAAILTWVISCPCDRTPGAWLFGEVVEEPVQDWSFANQVSLCQIQISGILPHALNLNCMASASGNLYLSCSFCEPKYWSGQVLKNPRSRLRLNEQVYPVNITRVTDTAEMEQAWAARVAKLQVVGDASNPAPPPDATRPDNWWTFRVVSR